MELPQIGRHCDESSCKQLDFLPLKCKCGKIYCSEHFGKHVEVCPSNTTNTTELKVIKDLYKCNHPSCSTKSIIPFLCEKCNNNFCVSHRHIVDCESTDDCMLAAKQNTIATIKKINDAKLAVDKEVDNILKCAKRNAKSVEMANKLQLMRIKNKASGPQSIPIDSRVYFNILRPGQGSDKVTPMFVSKVWPVGRAIDLIAKQLNLQNNNHQSNALKLRLFKREDGEIVSKSTSEVVEKLIQDKIIIDGDTLILDYVTDDCLKINVT